MTERKILDHSWLDLEEAILLAIEDREEAEFIINKMRSLRTAERLLAAEKEEKSS